MASHGLHLAKNHKPGGPPACGTRGHISSGYDKFIADENHCIKCAKSKLAKLIEKQRATNGE